MALIVSKQHPSPESNLQQNKQSKTHTQKKAAHVPGTSVIFIDAR
jgi:hypothetical protein